MYEFYEDLLERRDIDAVSIATPDHWHALVTIDACCSGKDVYVQKPLAYTIREGLEMVKAVRNNNRVLQVGSQQRSSKEFQQAIALVRSGSIGHIETIYACVDVYKRQHSSRCYNDGKTRVCAEAIDS